MCIFSTTSWNQKTVISLFGHFSWFLQLVMHHKCHFKSGTMKIVFFPHYMFALLHVTIVRTKEVCISQIWKSSFNTIFFDVKVQIELLFLEISYFSNHFKCAYTFYWHDIFLMCASLFLVVMACKASTMQLCKWGIKNKKCACKEKIHLCCSIYKVALKMLLNI